MPRTRWSPEKDAPLFDAVYTPALGLGFTARTQQEISDVRLTFATELGWNRERLERYRFRTLAAVARRTPERRVVLVKPPALIAHDMPEGLLEQQLAHMSSLPLPAAQAHFARVFETPPEVMDYVNTYRIQIADRTYDKARRLAEAQGRPLRPGDDRNGNPDLAALIERLIEEAHART